MEILKPIFAATSLIGIHNTGPFLLLLISNKTTYSTLISAFLKLHNELTNLTPDQLLVFGHFVSEMVFNSSLPFQSYVFVNQLRYVLTYSKEIINLLSIIMPKFADGFSTQRGALYGFGPNAENETDDLLKISNINADMKRKLDKAPVHNLSEEHSVVFVI